MNLNQKSRSLAMEIRQNLLQTDSNKNEWKQCFQSPPKPQPKEFFEKPPLVRYNSHSIQVRENRHPEKIRIGVKQRRKIDNMLTKQKVLGSLLKDELISESRSQETLEERNLMNNGSIEFSQSVCEDDIDSTYRALAGNFKKKVSKNPYEDDIDSTYQAEKFKIVSKKRWEDDIDSTYHVPNQMESFKIVSKKQWERDEVTTKESMGSIQESKYSTDADESYVSGNASVVTAGNASVLTAEQQKMALTLGEKVEKAIEKSITYMGGKATKSYEWKKTVERVYQEDFPVPVYEEDFQETICKDDNKEGIHSKSKMDTDTVEAASIRKIKKQVVDFEIEKNFEKDCFYSLGYLVASLCPLECDGTYT